MPNVRGGSAPACMRHMHGLRLGCATDACLQPQTVEGSGPRGGTGVGEPQRNACRSCVVTAAALVQAIRQVLEVLAYLHSRRVLHRDVKAENLQLTRPTREWVADIGCFHVKMIDFGLSCVMGDKAESGWLGTPGYVAPEVIDGKPHTPAMDVFSAGVILFMLLTGVSSNRSQVCLATACAVAVRRICASAGSLGSVIV